MQPIFTSTVPFEAERIAAVAITCSDGRYGDQFDEFMHRHLGLPRYDRLAIPGGAAWLGWRSSASLGHYGLLSDQLDFLVQVHDLRRAVLIAHYRCAYYLRRHPRNSGPPGSPPPPCPPAIPASRSKSTSPALTALRSPSLSSRIGERICVSRLVADNHEGEVVALAVGGELAVKVGEDRRRAGRG